MKHIKKLLLLLMVVSLIVVSTIMLTACGDDIVVPPPPPPGNQPNLNFEQVFAMAQELGFNGTLDDLIAAFRGAPGAQGPQGETGAPGQQGTPGAPGEQGATGETGAQGTPGAAGQSAFQIAVTHGFTGTEAQWLTSLIGAAAITPHINTTTGYWYIGTYNTGVNARGIQGETGAPGATGPQGNPGQQGAPGASAFDIWRAQPGNENGTEYDFLEWVRNEAAQGSQGPQGPQGTPGDSAFDIWRAQPGNEDGTEYDFLAWIQSGANYVPALPNVPTELSAIFGQTLADIDLPAGWAFTAPLTTPVGNAGTAFFHAAHTRHIVLLIINVEQATPISYALPNPFVDVAFGTYLQQLPLPASWEWVNTNTRIGAPQGYRTFAARYTPANPNFYSIVRYVSVNVIAAPVIEGQISTWQDWYNLLAGRVTGISGSFFLTNDICFLDAPVMNSVGYNGLNGDLAFNGILDGRGFTLRNMRIGLAPTPTAGVYTHWTASIFSGTGYNSVIRNLGVYNVTFGHGMLPPVSIGLLVGANRGLIENVFLHGTLISSGNYALYSGNAVIAGRNSGTIRNVVAVPTGLGTIVFRQNMASLRDIPPASATNVFVALDTFSLALIASPYPHFFQGGFGAPAPVFTNVNTFWLSDFTLNTGEPVNFNLPSQYWIITPGQLPQLREVTGIPVTVYSTTGATFYGDLLLSKTPTSNFDFIVAVDGNRFLGTPQIATYTLGADGSFTPVTVTPLGTIPSGSGFGRQIFNFRIAQADLQGIYGLSIIITGITMRAHHLVTIGSEFTLYHGNPGYATNSLNSAEWRLWDGTQGGETFTAFGNPPSTAVIGVDFTFAFRTLMSQGHFHSFVTRQSLVLTVAIGGELHQFRVCEHEAFPFAGTTRDYRFRIPAHLITGNIEFVSLDFLSVGEMFDVFMYVIVDDWHMNTVWFIGIGIMPVAVHNFILDWVFVSLVFGDITITDMANFPVDGLDFREDKTIFLNLANVPIPAPSVDMARMGTGAEPAFEFNRVGGPSIFGFWGDITRFDVEKVLVHILNGNDTVMTFELSFSREYRYVLITDDIYDYILMPTTTLTQVVESGQTPLVITQSAIWMTPTNLTIQHAYWHSALQEFFAANDMEHLFGMPLNLGSQIIAAEWFDRESSPITRSTGTFVVADPMG